MPDLINKNNNPDYIRLLQTEKNRLKLFTAISDALSQLKYRNDEIPVMTSKIISEMTGYFTVFRFIQNNPFNLPQITAFHPDAKIKNEFLKLQDNILLIPVEKEGDPAAKIPSPFLINLNGIEGGNADPSREEYYSFLRKYSISKVLVIPMQKDNMFFGSLLLYSMNIDSFSDEEQIFFNSVSNIISCAIRNSWFYDEKLREIEQQRQYGQEIKLLLQEKEALLREIHHRVKNNLQVISSLLNIQSEYVTDEASHKLFINSLNRIRTMSMIHENLYQTSNFSLVEIDKYLKDVVMYLYRTYNINARLVKLNIDIQSFSLPMETSITCGLIINELISNTFKHAFPDGRSGTVGISLLKSSERIMLSIADDGIGFTDNINLEKSTTFGLLLVHTLVDQLNAKLQVEALKGTKFVIEFSDSNN
jgi:two-component sensor histidine kinase